MILRPFLKIEISGNVPDEYRTPTQHSMNLLKHTHACVRVHTHNHTPKLTVIVVFVQIDLFCKEMLPLSVLCF